VRCMRDLIRSGRFTVRCRHDRLAYGGQRAHVRSVRIYREQSGSGPSMLMTMSTVALFFFPALMAFAASSDLLTMRISNRLVLLLAAGFFVVALAINMPMQQLAMH